MKFKIDYKAEKIEKPLTYGDLLIWKSPEDNKGEVVVISYDGLTSLNNPTRVWTFSLDDIRKYISSGDLEYLPKGTIITLEQE